MGVAAARCEVSRLIEHPNMEVLINVYYFFYYIRMQDYIQWLISILCKLIG